VVREGRLVSLTLCEHSYLVSETTAVILELFTHALEYEIVGVVVEVITVVPESIVNC